ncbi:MAG: glycosyltransferase family 4 protein [Jannaschia sp.]
MKPAAFAIPGDINTVTGGYIYERRLLEGLRGSGRDVRHIELPASFPDPDAQAMAEAVASLCALEPERSLILDGLVMGAIETRGLARVRAPIVAMIHHPLALETGLSAARQAHLFRTERDNLELAAQVLVPSGHTADIMTRDYDVDADKITVVRPGTDRRVRERAPTTPPLILSVGILHPRKGHDVLIRALAALTRHDWHAVIAGSAHDPEHAADLARMVRDLDLGDRVRLAGRVPSADLDALYARASIFALATRYEGYGMVFDEALTWGLPIVSCTAGAVPQTVPKGAGVLVPPDAPEAFSQALGDVLGDPDRLADMAAQSRRAGQELPSWQDAARIAGGVLDAT